MFCFGKYVLAFVCMQLGFPFEVGDSLLLSTTSGILLSVLAWLRGCGMKPSWSGLMWSSLGCAERPSVIDWLEDLYLVWACLQKTLTTFVVYFSDDVWLCHLDSSVANQTDSLLDICVIMRRESYTRLSNTSLWHRLVYSSSNDKVIHRCLDVSWNYDEIEHVYSVVELHRPFSHFAWAEWTIVPFTICVFSFCIMHIAVLMSSMLGHIFDVFMFSLHTLYDYSRARRRIKLI